MKYFRIVSVLLCFALLLSLTSPIAHATSSNSKIVENIIIEEDFALYSFKDSSCLFNIFLDTNSLVGSFAIIYSSNPEYMQEQVFTLAPGQLSLNSTFFWQEIYKDCIAHFNVLNTVHLSTAITSLKEVSPATRSAADDYFNDWLYEKYGPKYTNKLLGYVMKVSQLFAIYETLDYSANLSSSYYINTAISVAGFITAVLGVIADANLITIIGLVVGVAGMIPAGTQLNQYYLSFSAIKNVTVQGGSIIHASAAKFGDYDGYGNPKTAFYVVDENSESIGYYPSAELFNDQTALVNEAWNHFSNP